MRILSILFLFVFIGCGSEDSGTTEGSDNTDSDTRTTEPTEMGKADGVELTEEFCAWVTEESDGYCLEQCRDMDIDCEGVEPPPADMCEVQQRYDDGVCDEDCAHSDPDCDPPVDICNVDLLYANGTCDSECLYEDPDCKDALEDTGELTSGEREICGRINAPEDIIHELAGSICIDREGQTWVDCIEACVEEFQSNR